LVSEYLIFLLGEMANLMCIFTTKWAKAARRNHKVRWWHL